MSFTRAVSFFFALVIALAVNVHSSYATLLSVLIRRQRHDHGQRQGLQQLSTRQQFGDERREGRSRADRRYAADERPARSGP